MIQVTDDMLTLLREYQMGAYGELDDDCDKRMIAALIELHEANKPKPEPVAWAICRFEHIFETKEWAEKYREDWNMYNETITPIYTTPPTREPLSEDKLDELINACAVRYNQDVYVFDNSYDLIQFARAIEKSHGIGVTE